MFDTHKITFTSYDILIQLQLDIVGGREGILSGTISRWWSPTPLISSLFNEATISFTRFPDVFPELIPKLKVDGKIKIYLYYVG